MEMEGESAESSRKVNGETAGEDALVGGNKPLHRFLRIQPKFIGIVLMFFGVNEMMMGFGLMKEDIRTSASLYLPFWQAALLAICGSLSIHSHTYPSKKMVTVCLAMYVVTILAGFMTVFFRISCIIHFCFWGLFSEAHHRLAQLVSTESLLLTSALIVIVLLIVLCSYASASLKSSNTQIIVRQHLTVTDTENTRE
ncbi:uncharacterized protein si:ch1073-291c23.2 [Engraulis encrasicolus]|uniref:uncharacterized protein si:ch1073-291c23.2 n=1 Tax=Engraulis encrasicolus TaxID=184585 RepID=UPI002FD0D8C2